MLDIEERHGVAVLHMRRPFGVNCLDIGLLQRITAALEFVGSARGVVLTGYRTTFAIEAETAFTDDLHLAKRAALAAIRSHQGPVIAAVNGDALDTGFELASAADVRLMARGLIGTSTAPLTAADAAAIGLVELPACPAGLLDEAIQRVHHLLEPGSHLRVSRDTPTAVGG
jgi:enoyl-CoA hydratase/carnithine racemase